MADKAIGSLVEATVINDADRFVLEQSGQAKQISGATMISELAEALDGHGGIQSIDLVGGEGNTKTYRITMTDGSSYDFSVQDGESGNYAETAGQLVSTNYTEDTTTPYVIKACESGGSNRADETLIGGTFAWNQNIAINKIRETRTVQGVQFTNKGDGSVTLNGTATGTTYDAGMWASTAYDTTHVYFCRSRTESLAKGTSGVTDHGQFAIESGRTYNVTIYPCRIDLTLLFGPTIADYIYSLEQATVGSGVAWFKKYFPKPYYAYCAGALYSVNVGHKDNTGINAWNEEWELGTYNSSGNKTSAASSIRNINRIKVLPNTDYYFCIPSQVTNARKVWRDANGEFISYANNRYLSVTSPSNACYLDVSFMDYGTTYNHDICINRSNPEYNGNYYPRESHSVIFDNTVHLRGLPKLVNGELSFEGNDTYESTGVVTRKYGYVDMGSFADSSYNPYEYSGGIDGFTFTGLTSVIKKASSASVVGNIQAAGFVNVSDSTFNSDGKDKEICVNTLGIIKVKYDGLTTASAIKAAMSGKYLLYELAASTKETHDAFDNPQVIYDGGTNYFVDYSCENGDRDVEIPVGHSTRFLANLAGTLDSMYGALPSANGTYTLKATVSSGKITYSWVADE